MSEYKYKRTTSKGEKVFRRDTNESIDDVEKYLIKKLYKNSLFLKIKETILILQINKLLKTQIST